MITFTELLERAKTEEIAIHTPTEEQAVTLLKALDKKGYEWTNSTTRHGVWLEDTCYDFDLNKQVCYCSLKFYQNEGYTVIEFADIDFKEK